MVDEEASDGVEGRDGDGAVEGEDRGRRCGSVVWGSSEVVGRW